MKKGSSPDSAPTRQEKRFANVFLHSEGIIDYERIRGTIEEFVCRSVFWFSVVAFFIFKKQKGKKKKREVVREGERERESTAAVGSLARKERALSLFSPRPCPPLLPPFLLSLR